MRKILINGVFADFPLTGVERVAFNLLTELDKLCKDLDVEFVIPKCTEIDISYKNIKIVRYGSRKGPLWVQFDYKKYVKKNNGITVGMGTYMPFFIRNGIVWIHDIRDIVVKKAAPLKYKILAYISGYFRCHFSDTIVTVSEFSKSEIIKVFNISGDKIKVIYNGWQHFSDADEIRFDNSNYPFLKEKDYFFYLGSIVKHKNLKWVIETAKNNPSQMFIISGMQINRLKNNETDDFNLENVRYMGYLSDDDVKMLMKYCKAFVFPSLHEGFGIPPLEALSFGAKAIVSNAAALPEVYGDTVYYIDPYDYNVNLEELLSGDVGPADSVLKKYSYEKSAMQLYELIQAYCDK